MKQSKPTEQKNNGLLEISTEVLEEIRNQAKEKVLKAEHTWVQRGPYLVCKSCEFEHALHIGTSLMYKGKDKNGRPILEGK